MWELISVLYSDRIEVERMTDEDMATDVLVSVVIALLVCDVNNGTILTTCQGLKGVSDKETADDFFIKESTVRQAQVSTDI